MALEFNEKGIIFLPAEPVPDCSMCIRHVLGPGTVHGFRISWRLAGSVGGGEHAVSRESELWMNTEMARAVH